MRTSHYYLFGVALVTLGFVAAAPAAAQNQQASFTEISQNSNAPDPEMTPDQRADFETWPTEKQSEYELWPAETKGYYWTLSAPRQVLFWRLSDEDKIALTAMTGPERENTWVNIEGRAAAPNDGAL